MKKSNLFLSLFILMISSVFINCKNLSNEILPDVVNKNPNIANIKDRFTGTATSLTIYPSPVGADSLKATDVTVKINDSSSFVYNMLKNRLQFNKPTIPTEFTAFDFSGGTVSVNATYPGVTITSAVIRPASAGITPVISGNTVSFVISVPGHYVVEINNDIIGHRPLAIFANPTEINKPSSTDPNVIYYAAGSIYEAGLINVNTSGKTIYIEGGAIVKGYINISNTSNIHVKGRGIFYSINPVTGATIPPVVIKNSNHVDMSDLIMVNRQDQWLLHPSNCSYFTCNNIKVLNEIRDGIDIDASNNVNVTNSYIQAQDDALCIKAVKYNSNDSVANVFTVNFQNDVVFNCGAGNAMEIGRESNTTRMHAITFKNIDVIHSLAPGCILGIHIAGYPQVYDVTFENIRIEDNQEFYTTDLQIAGDGSPIYTTSTRGFIHDILFNNITQSSTTYKSSKITGYDSIHQISNITFENYYKGSTKVTSLAVGGFYPPVFSNNIVFQ